MSSIYSFREEDNYEQNGWGFAISTSSVDPILVYQGYPLEEEWEEPVFYLEYGDFPDYLSNICGWTICSTTLKEAILKNVNKSKITWLPILVQKGDEQRRYHAMLIDSFLKLEDVVNFQKSKRLKSGEVYLPIFSHDKIKDLDTFVLEDKNSTIFIAEKIMRILSEKNLKGLGFEAWRAL